MKSLSIVVMSQIKLIPTPSWLVYFVLKAQPFFINFASFEHAKNLQIMGPNNTKNSALKCDFLIFNYE